MMFLNLKIEPLINKYFDGKTDKGGNNYKNHLYYVAYSILNEKSLKVKDKKSSLSLFYDKAYYVALLHDILEDTDCSEQELRDIGCDDEIIDAIKAITRKKEEQYYFDFIKRVSQNDIARIVKIYDLEHNMDIRRLNTFGDYEQKRLKKYWYSWKYLKGEISEIECNNSIHPNRKFR